MKSYTVEKFVDYLSFTTHDANFDNRFAPLWQYTKSPIANYDTAKMYKSGMLQLSHSKRKELGVHFIASGECLKYIRENELTEQELLKRVCEFAQVSRIDIAVTSCVDDYSEHELTPNEIVKLCIANKLISRLDAAKEVSKDFQTQTKYIGNQKTRRRLFRAYDKGLEDGGEAGRIVRYELETRRGGNVIARAVRDGADIGGLIRRYVDFDSELYRAIMNAEPAKITHEEATGELPLDAHEKARLERIAKWQWLNDSIAPMVRRLMSENSSVDGITQYENEYIAEFKKKAGIS